MDNKEKEKEKESKLYSTVIKYTEEGDTNSTNNDITFSMSSICYDMGYIVMQTDRWAIDASPEGIQEFMDMINDFMNRSKVDTKGGV